MKPAHKVSLDDLSRKDIKSVEKLMSRNYGERDDVWREKKPKLKAKDRRKLDKKLNGKRLAVEHADAYAKNLRMNREFSRKRRRQGKMTGHAASTYDKLRRIR